MRTTRTLALLTLCAIAATQLPGCNIVAAGTYLFAPRPLTKAVYPLPDKKTVIFIEDATADLRDPALVRNLAANVEKWLVDEKTLAPGQVVPPDQLEAYLASLGEQRDNTALGDIARHFNAGQLIYIKITGYQMAVGGGVYRPQLTTQVKCLDMDQRKRVMPPDRDPESGIQTNIEYITVQSKLPAINRTSEGSNARVLAGQQLAAEAGEDIAKLFFDWRQDEPGEDLGRR